MKEEFHSSHLGIQACLCRGRECIFWPQMNSEITEYISRCEIYQWYAAKQRKEPLMPLDIPNHPWQAISTDLFDWNDKNYLVTVDHFSNFIEVNNLLDTLSGTVVKKVKVHIARFGQPDIVVSDNGSQFLSSEFEKFAKSWNFIHWTSSPHHQQANGRAEAAVKICKHIMTKASEDKKDVYKALLAQLNTIQEGFSTSPAQWFLGWRAKTDLPTTKSLLQPNTNHLSDKRDMISRQQAYDKHTKELQPLKEQDNVCLKPVSLGDKVWAKAKVIKHLDERFYLVDNSKRLLRRNRVDLQKTLDTKQSISIDNDVKDVETRLTILQSYTGSQTVHDSGSKTW